jgi:peptide/nickel transport system permease protein
MPSERTVVSESAGVDVTPPDEPGATLIAPPSSNEPRRWRLGPFKIAALAWVVLIVGAALLAPILPLRSPTAGGLGVAKAPFGANGLLGTDELGRDILSRTIYGARISLLISCSSVAIALVIGVALGLFTGYFRGKFDTCVNAVVDVILAFPGIILLTVVVSFAGPSVHNLIITIAIIKIPPFMRLARASTLSYAEREFVLAARGVGTKGVRIAVREILPNVLPAVTAYTFAEVGLVFVLEGSLSFLGLGVQSPTASWGGMIASGRTLLASSPHMVLIPGITLFLTVLAFNALSEGWGATRRARKLG